MKIQGNDVKEMKALLQESWREGNKWVAYDVLKTVTPDNISMFKTAEAANEFCDAYSEDFVGRFKAINSVIKSLYDFSNGVTPSPVNEQVLSYEINRYSLQPVNASRDLINGIGSGELYPVMLPKTIEPEKEIDRFAVVEHLYPTGMIYEIGHRLKETMFYNYSEAIKPLHDKMALYSSEQKRERPELLLIGEFKHQRLALDYEGRPDKNTGLLLSISYSSYGTTGRPQAYEEHKINELNAPAVINQPVLACFRNRTGKLTFYDDQFRALDISKFIPFQRVECFDFRNPITVKGIQQDINQTVNKEEPLSSRNRNRLS